ncbi:MAG: hypothetical protein ACFE8O_08645 [Candidatus Hermodarchaeota archaeon]
MAVWNETVPVDIRCHYVDAQVRLVTDQVVPVIWTINRRLTALVS